MWMRCTRQVCHSVSILCIAACSQSSHKSNHGSLLAEHALLKQLASLVGAFLMEHYISPDSLRVTATCVGPMQALHVQHMSDRGELDVCVHAVRKPSGSELFLILHAIAPRATPTDFWCVVGVGI